MQLGLDKKPHIAWRLALAAAMVEYGYAWVAVKFEAYITSSALVVRYFQLMAALVILTLGLLIVRAAGKPGNFTKKLTNSGFRRGLALGILNPLAMPFWLGVTAYLKSQHWITLSTPLQLHTYLAGVSSGVFTLLVSVAYLATRADRVVRNKTVLLKKIPGYIMICLGIVGLMRYLITFT